MLGIYVHIPFCVKRCGYCDFCSSVIDRGTLEKYVAALVRRIDAFPVCGDKADTVYFGGGTPSLMSERQFSEILAALHRKFAIQPGSEITTEANPGTVDREKLTALKRLGINRLSLGIQSCKAKELATLGRIHSFDDAQKSVESALLAGIENISADIMLGIPYQTPETAAETVEKVSSLGLSHISAYMLKTEPGTPFDSPKIAALLPSDDEVCDMYLNAVKALSERGFAQYEISNFARPGMQSRHNLKYWEGEPYIGFGASAHSLYKGKRLYTKPDISAFISDPLSPDETEDASPDKAEEYVMLGLRLCKGISLDRADRLGASSERILSVCRPYIDGGFMTLSGGRLAFTPKGFLVSNSIISKII